MAIDSRPACPPVAQPGLASAEPVRSQAATVGQRGWRFTPHVIIFFSSACIMIVELVAGRLIARHLGSSLYTWTTIIGVVLAGMSIGNWIGGRLADRWPSKAFLGWLFMIASATCALALLTNYLFADVTGDQVAWLPKWLKDYFQQPGEGKWVARIVLAVVVIFLPPAMALGTISPATAKLALDRCSKVGSTIGSVYAWGAVGSIVGTFATGFYLIVLLGATGVVLTTALGLAVIGLCLGPHRWAHVIWVLLLAAALLLAKAPLDFVRRALLGGQSQSVAARALDRAEWWGYELGLRNGQKGMVWDAELEMEIPDGTWQRYPFAADSNYQFVRVEDKLESGRMLRMLTLDYLIHGYVDMDDPTYLHYDYERLYCDVARRYYQMSPRALPLDKSVDAFFIGGGAYTFQRWVMCEWPGSRVEVAEIDPAVVDANHEATGLERDTPIRTYVGDARNVVDDLPPDRKYDFIFGDAFTDLSVPFHLTTLEFSRKVAGHLKPDGAYLVNVIDDFRFGEFLGAYVLTLQRVFKHVYVFCTDPEGVSEGRETFVVAASNVPLDVRGMGPSELPADEDEDEYAEDYEGEIGGGNPERFRGSLLTPENLAELQRKCGRRILTDDNAPVENLLEPVVRTR